MNIRLEQFMRAEKLTSAKLAEILQIQPSSISHLLSGRNKPGFDFLSKLMLMFPELNPDWIINAKGDMYRSENDKITDPNTAVTKLTSTSTNHTYSAQNELFSSITDVNDELGDEIENSAHNSVSGSIDDCADGDKIEISKPIGQNKANEAEKIVIFYPDNSFDIFHQRRSL